MIQRLIWNDINRNRLFAVATCLITAITTMLFALTIFLLSQLLGSMDLLMARAKTPDFLQMHVGSLDMPALEQFHAEHSEIEDWQVLKFLNLNNSALSFVSTDESSAALAKADMTNQKGTAVSLADSTQDNGLTVQAENFDFLLTLDDEVAEAGPGEVYVPITYRSLYDVKVGDILQIGTERLTVAGFVRDSQMNSMMSSSKRFLVNPADYERLLAQGEEEYLIEYRLLDPAAQGAAQQGVAQQAAAQQGAAQQGANQRAADQGAPQGQPVDSNAFATAYAEAGLPANGPTITRPLIRMMNALSDGMMIFVILIVSLAVLVVSLLSLHFITAIQMEKDRREVGLLKAIGTSRRDLKKIYFAKYFLLTGLGGIIGFVAAGLVQAPLAKQMQDLYGKGEGSAGPWLLAFLTAAVLVGLIMLFVWRKLKATDQVTALEAMFVKPVAETQANRRQYLLIGVVTAVCVSLMLIPQNLSSTLESPDFVTYMGIGNADVRLDVRQTEDIGRDTEALAARLREDQSVTAYSVLQTRAYLAELSSGQRTNLLIEQGDHSIFPVAYCSGRAPSAPGEIALSNLNAEELQVVLGDTIRLGGGESAVAYTVCGIYSDITNGGKTAKISASAADQVGATGTTGTAGATGATGTTGVAADAAGTENPLMWSVVYAALAEHIAQDEWVRSYKTESVEVVAIGEYMQGTYGQTLEQIKLAKIVAYGIAAGIIVVVVALFIRLIVERDRNRISLHKALGLTGKRIRQGILAKALAFSCAGIALGILLGIGLGQQVSGLFLQSLGADGFRFTLVWWMILLVIPAIGLGASALAVRLGVAEVQHVKAYECCIGRE